MPTGPKSGFWPKNGFYPKISNLKALAKNIYLVKYKSQVEQPYLLEKLQNCSHVKKLLINHLNQQIAREGAQRKS